MLPAEAEELVPSWHFALTETFGVLRDALRPILIAAM